MPRLGRCIGAEPRPAPQAKPPPLATAAGPCLPRTPVYRSAVPIGAAPPLCVVLTWRADRAAAPLALWPEGTPGRPYGPMCESGPAGGSEHRAARPIAGSVKVADKASRPTGRTLG